MEPWENTFRKVEKHYLEIGEGFFIMMENIQPGEADWIFDVSCLPHSKEEIQQALLFRFGLEKDHQKREGLAIAMQYLAHFQTNIGDEPLKPLLTNFDKMDGTEEGINSAIETVLNHGPAFERWKETMDQIVLPEIRQTTILAENMAENFWEVLLKVVTESLHQSDDGKDS